MRQLPNAARCTLILWICAAGFMLTSRTNVGDSKLKRDFALKWLLLYFVAEVTKQHKMTYSKRG